MKKVLLYTTLVVIIPSAIVLVFLLILSGLMKFAAATIFECFNYYVDWCYDDNDYSLLERIKNNWQEFT